MNNQYKKKSSYSSFKKGENEYVLYSIPDSIVFNGSSSSNHYYIQDEYGGLHKLKDPERGNRLSFNRAVKGHSEGIFDNCPFLIKKSSSSVTRDKLLEHFIRDKKRKLLFHKKREVVLPPIFRIWKGRI